MEFSTCEKCNNKAFFEGECSHCGYIELLSDTLGVTITDDNILFLALGLINYVKKSKTDDEVIKSV